MTMIKNYNMKQKDYWCDIYIYHLDIIFTLFMYCLQKLAKNFRYYYCKSCEKGWCCINCKSNNKIFDQTSGRRLVKKKN